MIPYLVAPEVSLAFLVHVPIVGTFVDAQHPPSITPLDALVTLGAIVGASVASRHARDRGLNPQRVAGFIAAVMVGGLIGSHVAYAFFYNWPRLVADPTYLVHSWEGLSTFGGFAGALLGALFWHRHTDAPILPYADVVSSAFPLAWMFGRAGCALVHDHPGRRSDAWFAVAYPTVDGWEGRFDLGLYEMVLTVPLAVLFLVLWRGGRQRLGFYTGTMCAIYAPLRFGLDFLRVAEGSAFTADPRYLGLTPAQWGCLALLPFGLYVLRSAPPRGRLILNRERWEGPS